MTTEQVTIYALCDEDGAVQYVGQTRNVERRRQQHRHSRPALTLIVVTHTDEEHANEVERSWIEHYRAQGLTLLNAARYRPGRRRDPAAPDDAEERGKWTSLRLTDEERAHIARVAARENRKMAEQIRQFIHEGLARRAAEDRRP